MTLEILDWHDGDLLAKPVFESSMGWWRQACRKARFWA